MPSGAIKSPLPRLRKLCLALPEAHEVEAWGTPTFRVCNKQFAMYVPANFHESGTAASVWCKATLDNQEFLVAADPARYFVPPYVGKSGWVGVNLDRRVVWSELADLLADGYRLAAPRRLVTRAKERAASPPGRRDTARASSGSRGNRQARRTRRVE